MHISCIFSFTYRHCHSNAMFEAPEGNSYGAKFYGSAAISEALGGGNWMAEGCGKCWKVTGTSNAGSIAPGVQTTLVLKGTNFCPPGKSAFVLFCCMYSSVSYEVSMIWILITKVYLYLTESFATNICYYHLSSSSQIVTTRIF